MSIYDSVVKVYNGSRIVEVPVSNLSHYVDISEDLLNVDGGVVPIDDPASTINTGIQLQTPSGTRELKEKAFNRSHLYDDFEDGQLTGGKDNFVQTHPEIQLTGGYGNETEPRGAGGVSHTRTSWTVDSGSPTVSNGQLDMNDGGTTRIISNRGYQVSGGDIETPNLNFVVKSDTSDGVIRLRIDEPNSGWHAWVRIDYFLDEIYLEVVDGSQNLNSDSASSVPPLDQGPHTLYMESTSNRIHAGFDGSLDVAAFVDDSNDSYPNEPPDGTYYLQVSDGEASNMYVNWVVA